MKPGAPEEGGRVFSSLLLESRPAPGRCGTPAPGLRLRSAPTHTPPGQRPHPHYNEGELRRPRVVKRVSLRHYANALCSYFSDRAFRSCKPVRVIASASTIGKRSGDHVLLITLCPFVEKARSYRPRVYQCAENRTACWSP